MAKGKFKVNKQGFNELRNSAAVKAILAQHAAEIESRAESLAGDPGGFETEVVSRETRAVAFVRAESAKAMRACQDRNVLLKAVR